MKGKIRGGAGKIHKEYIQEVKTYAEKRIDTIF